jgi:hypothetical protein
VVPRVRNQQQCGSCWAFATAGAAASRMALQHQVLFELSPQQVLDCFKPQQYGCVGGSFATAMRELELPLELFRDRPYRGEVAPAAAEPAAGGASSDAGACAEDAQARGVVQLADGATVLTQPSNERIRRELHDAGPLAAAVESHSRCFQFYRAGVLDDSPCRAAGAATIGKPNHAVLLVGYENWGTDKAAWIIANSWGEDWGANAGYVFVKVDAEQDGKQDGNFAIRSILARPNSANFSPRCQQDVPACRALGRAVNTSSANATFAPSPGRRDDWGLQGVDYTVAKVLILGGLALAFYSLLRILWRALCGRRAKPADLPVPVAVPLDDDQLHQSLLEPQRRHAIQSPASGSLQFF